MLTWIFRHPRLLLALSGTLTAAVMLIVGTIASREQGLSREIEVVRELAGYAATLEAGTGSSRAMGAIILFGVEDQFAQGLAQGRLPAERIPQLVDKLARLRQLYFAEEAFVIAGNGAVLATSSKSGEAGDPWGSVAAPIVRAALKGGPTVYPAVRSRGDRHERGIFLAAPLRSDEAADGKVLGAVGVMIGADKLINVLEGWSGGPALLLSPQGVVFAASRKDWNLRLTDSVSPAQLAAIRDGRQFGDAFDRQLGAPLPFNSGSAEVTVDGATYALRSQAMEWNDPEGEWAIVLLDRRWGWLHQPFVLGAATLAGLATALFLGWLYFLLRREKEKTQQEAFDAQQILVENLRAHERVLEQRVEERTRELQEINHKLEALSMTDSLTGLANRRRFDETLDSDWGRAIRFGQPLALALLDVDRFKRYNDHYGHQQGDACLCIIARALEANFGRSADLVARFGGEEFVIIMPNTNSAGALAHAQKMCDAIQALAMPHAQSEYGCVTVSIGVVATVPHDGQSSEILVKHADEALYRAKAQGRNRTLLSEIEPAA
jgi:diguanylate cyclase (GGDEF)-like protein